MRLATTVILLTMVTGSVLYGTVSGHEAPGSARIATFSIVAYDREAEEWGVAVQSRFLAVGAVVPWAKAGVGAIATQAWGNTVYGPEGCALMEMGVPPDRVVEILTSKDEERGRRQLGVVDAQGRAAAYTGENCLPWAGHIVGEGFCVQGNILAGKNVIERMAEAFQTSQGPLARRLLAALAAGQEAGGDSRGKQSAALLVVREAGGYSGYNDRFIDLRVDDHPNPIDELGRILGLHEQTFQTGAYTRVAVAAFKRGDETQANFLLGRALAIMKTFPDNATVLNSIAWELAINEFRLDEAVILARRAVELAPDDGNIWDTLGEVYARRGEYAEAVKAEEKAVALGGGAKEFKDKLERWRTQTK